MPKLAANLSLLFPQLEFRERFAAAALREAGMQLILEPCNIPTASAIVDGSAANTIPMVTRRKD